jgi:hypothetical protein
MQEAVQRSFHEPVQELLSSEIVLPAQFWGSVVDPRCEPEKKLMAAVLEEAVATLVNGRGYPNREDDAVTDEARRWIDSDDRSGPFTFATICDVLGLEVGHVREIIWHRVADQKPYVRRRRLQAGRGRHRVRDVSRRERRVA